MRTGPYTAVRRVELALASQTEYAERVEVGIRQGVRKSGTNRKPAWSMTAARGLRGKITANAPFAKIRKPLVPTLPGCEEDFHLQAVEPARHTNENRPDKNPGDFLFRHEVT